jgi:hypothetical protein
MITQLTPTKFPPTQLIVVLILTLLLLACEAQNSPTKSPPLPNGVPKEAMWIGGVDGGVFVVLTKAPEPRTFLAEVYFDQSGELWYKGRLQLESENQSEFDYTNAAAYTAWDGDTLYLTDGRELKAMDKTE